MLCEVSGSKLVSREGGSKLGVEGLEASLCAPCVLAGVGHGALLVADVSKSNICLLWSDRGKTGRRCIRRQGQEDVLRHS